MPSGDTIRAIDWKLCPVHTKARNVAFWRRVAFSKYANVNLDDANTSLRFKITIIVIIVVSVVIIIIVVVIIIISIIIIVIIVVVIIITISIIIINIMVIMVVITVVVITTPTTTIIIIIIIIVWLKSRYPVPASVVANFTEDERTVMSSVLFVPKAVEDFHGQVTSVANSLLEEFR